MPHYYGEHLWAAGQGAWQSCCCFRHPARNSGVFMFRHLLPYKSRLLFLRAWSSKVRCSNAGIAENLQTLNTKELRPVFTFKDLFNILKHRGLKARVVIWAHASTSEGPNGISSLIFLIWFKPSSLNSKYILAFIYIPWLP